MTTGGSGIAHGFPHLDTVRAALTALFRRLSHDTVSTFPTSVLPVDVAFDDTEDVHLGAQRIARAMVRQLHLPDARIVITFREMEHAATVELTAGPEYFVELNDRFRRHRKDIGAALAHEVTHVWLHRLDLSFPGTRDNEILTDTAAAYLGAGWLLLDAYREHGPFSQKLGYLTPEEFGYVLAKRADFFAEDPAPWFTSPQAYDAYTAGRARARQDARRPPLAGAGWAARLRYARTAAPPRTRTAPPGPPPAPVTATPSSPPPAPGAAAGVVPCPTCWQRIRVPVRGHLQARCGLCKTLLDCDT
ncbi:hypothetical protein O1L44_26065 [Streptomyces noursei]|nr:hypothetical protein [Streptomyces noursei]